MIDRFEAVWDSQVPYKQIRVAPELMNNYMPPSVKPQVPLLIRRGESTTAAQLFVDDTLMDNRVHLDPVTARNLGFGEENEKQTVTLEQAAVERAEQIIVQNAAEPPEDAGQREPDIREHLSRQLFGQFLVVGDETVVPEEHAGTHLPFVVTDYAPRGTEDTVAYVTEDTLITVNLVDDENQVTEHSAGTSLDTTSSQNMTSMQANLEQNTSVEGETSQVTYDSIGGLKEEIKQVRELVERPLTDPEAFQGVSTPSGVLLHGPPGTGKTMLAKAVANEVDASFYALSGSEIFERNYGESEENLRSLFEEASDNKPSIIFIDELESLIPPREELSPSNQVERRVVNQLKTLMDGFSSEEELLVLGATNHISEIDDSFLRPGRFDRQIEIGVPKAEERREIIQIHTRNMKLDFGDEYMDELVQKTTGYTGADIEGLCLQANMEMQRRLVEEYPEYTGETRVSEILRREDEGYKPEDFEQAIKETEPSLLKRFNIDVPEVRWTDIGGHASVKQRLREQVDGPLKAPELWSEDEQSTGILLYGPPGTGKTLLAKAMATESNRVFIGVQATELRSKWVGETERAVRQLFSLAESLEPSILYIDEIEAIAQERGGEQNESGVSDTTTSQLLSELDGIEDRGDVIVVGSTNADYDPETPLQRQNVRFGLDPAILRPGRLESHYHIGSPGLDERKEIFRIHLDKVSEGESVELADGIDVDRLAKMTENLSGADVEGVCWEAKHIARNSAIEDAGGLDEVEADEIVISQENLEEAIDKYTGEHAQEVNAVDRMYS